MLRITLFCLTALSCPNAKTEEFMFQNVAYRPTVYQMRPTTLQLPHSGLHNSTAAHVRCVPSFRSLLYSIQSQWPRALEVLGICTTLLCYVVPKYSKLYINVIGRGPFRAESARSKKNGQYRFFKRCFLWSQL